MLTYANLGYVGPFENVYVKVKRADLTCDVIRKVAPFVLGKL